MIVMELRMDPALYNSAEIAAVIKNLAEKIEDDSIHLQLDHKNRYTMREELGNVVGYCQFL